jgi:hypothetical protein
VHAPALSTPPPRSRPLGEKLRRNSIALLSAFAIAIPIAVVSTPSPALAVTDEHPSFVLNQNDLEFILRQIQISEAHAADELDPSNYTLLCASPQDASGTCVPDVARPAGLRTVDCSTRSGSRASPPRTSPLRPTSAATRRDRFPGRTRSARHPAPPAPA